MEAADEILPLLEHNRSDEGDSNFGYHSTVSANETAAVSKQKSDNTCCIWSEEMQEEKNAATVWSRGNRSSFRLVPHHEGNTLGGNVTYSWINLNVYSASENKKKPPCWRRLANLMTRREFRRLAEPKRILKNAYGIAYSGEFLAIMGPSGAGKSTLLNALTFQSGIGYVVKGSRYLNGLPIKNKDAVARLSAYVEQENLFVGTLTVREHLIFQSLIRMDRNISYRQKLERVEDVMSELGLEKCQNTTIGYPGRTKGISGGELKRLAFATEVLTNPSIMFCDEPTSGLDSFMAQNVIGVLKSMANRGKTVICTIHQPSSEMFSLFDKILLLAEGRTAFLGEPSKAILFFAELGASPPAHYNPADFFIQLLAVIPDRESSCKETINMICDSFDQSPHRLEIDSNIECEIQNKLSKEYGSCNPTPNRGEEQFAYPATWFCQFRALFWRSWTNILKEPILVKVRLFQTVVLSLIVGLIYHQQKLNEDGVMNVNGVLFTFLTNMTFQNLFAVISAFCTELPIFMKEHSSKLYRVDAYFLSKTLAEIPMFLFIPVIFTSITYYWIKLNPGPDHFAFTVVILILVTNVATSFGYFISCISKNVVMALSVGPPVIIPFLLFGGFLLNSGAIPTYFKWLSYLSWFRSGNEALLINQWSDIENIECNKSNVTCPRTGKVVLEMYHFQAENFWWDISSLLALILLFRSLAFLGLFFKTCRHEQPSDN